MNGVPVGVSGRKCRFGYCTLMPLFVAKWEPATGTYAPSADVEHGAFCPKHIEIACLFLTKWWEPV